MYDKHNNIYLNYLKNNNTFYTYKITKNFVFAIFADYIIN